MPSQKPRSKEDTWTTDELSRALNKTGERRHHRDRDDDRKRERVIGDDRRKRKDEDSDRRHHDRDDDRRRRHRGEDRDDVQLSEAERDRQRRERREKREGKDGKERKSKGEIPFNTKAADREIELNDINEDDDRQRRHHGDRERGHKDESNRHHRNGEERKHHDRERRHRDEDEDRDKRRRHRVEEEDEEDERERRRRERRKDRESAEDAEKRKGHEEKKERRREDTDRDRKKDRDRDERSDRRDRKDRDRDRNNDRDKRRDREEESERDREKRKEKEREERRREREERHKVKEREERKERSHKSSKKQEEKEEEKEEEDEYNYEEDDFEDYEEDFEEDDDDGDEDADNNIEDSEVNDVLKALDAENERLLQDSASPQISRSRRDDDDEEDSDDQYERAYQPRQDRPRTAINFVSAKQRAISRKTASKTMQRSNDLLKMIELDYISFDVLDMPPVNEYDLYIRAFGNSNTRQAYVQTNDDNIDREIQTDEVDARQKWTQYPSDTLKGCGRGDGEKDVEEEEESLMKQNREEDMGKLSKFLEKAGQVISILLEEDKEMEIADRGGSKSHINISDSFTQIDLLPILEGRYVVYSHFSPVQPNLLLTAYSPAAQVTAENPVSKKGIVCVWNTNDSSYPQKILACSSQPRCCCFSPVKPSLVFAGMVDGSIAMWDLREPSSLHQPTVVNQEEYSLRFPTYDTAGVLTEENHHSPVCTICPIYSYISSPLPTTHQSQASDDSSGLSFQLVSTEDSAVLHFWVVAEIGSPDFAGSQSDLGLSPGGRVKLLKSSTLTLENPNKLQQLQSSVKAIDMKILPSDPNQFYVSTDSGVVIHGVRFGNRAFPRAHAPVIETIVDVVSIDFSPFEEPCFLAGCSDGSFSLYYTKSEHPLITWPQVTHGRPVQCVRWSRSRPCVFFVLDEASTLYIFDLLEGDLGPKQVETISKERVISFTLTNDHNATGLGIPGKDPQMLFSLEGGKTEIHTIAKSLTVPEQLETDYLGSYLQRF